MANAAPRTKKGRTVKPKPAARPMTAAQRADRRAEYQTHLSIVEAVLPRG